LENASQKATLKLHDKTPKPKFTLPEEWKGNSQYVSKSKTISHIQNIFTDSQKIAYLGLCYLSMHNIQKTRLRNADDAASSYQKWSLELIEKLYIYLDISVEGGV
jgi:hypothetical protein